MVSNILLVCFGNICRSPMAEGLFKKHLEHDDSYTKISSAGLHALVGRPAVPEAVELMAEYDIDISSHRARQLTQELLFASDLILVMEKGHKKEIETLSPNVRGRVFLLGHWGDFEIPDPFRQTKGVFANGLQLIEQGLQEWKGKL